GPGGARLNRLVGVAGSTVANPESGDTVGVSRAGGSEAGRRGFVARAVDGGDRAFLVRNSFGQARQRIGLPAIAIVQAAGHDQGRDKAEPSPTPEIRRVPHGLPLSPTRRATENAVLVK